MKEIIFQQNGEMNMTFDSPIYGFNGLIPCLMCRELGLLFLYELFTNLQIVYSHQ